MATEKTGRNPVAITKHGHRPPLDVREAAEYLGTSERHVRRLISERRLSYALVGGKVRLLPDDLDALLAAGRVEAQPWLDPALTTRGRAPQQMPSPRYPDRAPL